MKVMVVGNTAPDMFADNVAHAFSDMGHQVTSAGPARSTMATLPGKAQLIRRLVLDASIRADAASQHHLVRSADVCRPDLIVSLDRRIQPVVVEELAQFAPTVLWFPDAVSNMDRHQMFLADYARIYLKNPVLSHRLKAIYGARVAYLPEAAYPGWHRPIGPYGSSPTIAVAGNVHPTRAMLLSRLINAGINLRIYGTPIPGWVGFPDVRAAHTGATVFREEKAAVFRGARAVLNNLHPAEYAGANCRLFEAAGSGAVVLTEWRDGMSDLFRPGSEVLPFETFDDLVDSCRSLLADPEHGRAVGDAAARRVLQDHTYELRLAWMLDDLQLG